MTKIKSIMEQDPVSTVQKKAGSQGGRTWQAFGGGKNGHETFRQARIYNFCDKCVVFACPLNEKIHKVVFDRFP